MANTILFEMTKKVDMASGKVTYSRTIGKHTASCIASCEAEAKSKLGSDLLCALGLDGVIEETTCIVKQVYLDKIDAVIAERAASIHDLQQQLVTERNRSWFTKLKASLWTR